MKIALLISFCIYSAISIIAAKSRSRKITKVSIAAAASLLTAAWIFINELSGNGIDDSVLYHMHTGVSGAGISEFTWKIAPLVAYILATAAFSVYICRRQLISQRRSSTIFYLALAAITAANPLTRDIARLAASSFSGKDIENAAVSFIEPTGKIGKKKNLVVLYLESFEQTYYNEDVFPGLTPNLNSLRKRSLDFVNVDSRPGGTWTIAGMVSSLCGTPLSLNNDANGYGSIGRFMPKANCLTDILATNGYHLQFVGGATSEFAGKGQFLKDHGFHTIIDKSDFKNSDIAEKHFSSWGVHDDILLERMWQDFVQLSDAGSPFALVGLTLDTHHPSGHIANSCLDINYQGAGARKSLLDAVACSDRLVASFAEKVLSSPHMDNTVLAIVSDHVAMPNDVHEILSNHPRKNTVMIFDNQQQAQVVDAPASTLDTAATLLDLLHGGNAIAFSRSQLPGNTRQPSITYEGAADNHEAPSMRAVLNYSKSLWALGDINDGIRLASNKLHIGDQQYTPPAIFVSDPAGRITEVGTRGIHSDIEMKNQGDRITLVDRCVAFDIDQDPASWCIWSDTDGAPKAALLPEEEQINSLSGILAQAADSIPYSSLRKDFIIKSGFMEQDTVYGSVVNESIISTGREGIILYGPHQNLCAGEYTLHINGESSNAEGSWIDMVSEYGNKRYDQVSINDRISGEIAVARYFFETDVNLAEVRAYASPGAELKINNYQLLPTLNTMPVDEEIDFSSTGLAMSYISCGWKFDSTAGTRTNARNATIRFKTPEAPLTKSAVSLTMNSNQAASVQLESSMGTRTNVEVDGATTVIIPIPDDIGSATTGKPVSIDFHINNCAPQQCPEINLISAKIEENVS
ncbi:sulfatase-like hydrolase/transferase [Stenotrophomonas koreensis]|uniref:sulfatase-like hydrolase/transferase n=1 Tax=Stenotrophomonas koreensis TaxID=266128 RepID=UPI0009F84EF2|nr:sulfatase-like hydrolase/transferase [Stenotrophomonas koreensis]